MPALHFGEMWQVLRHFGVLIFAIEVPLNSYFKFHERPSAGPLPYNTLYKINAA